MYTRKELAKLSEEKIVQIANDEFGLNRNTKQIKSDTIAAIIIAQDQKAKKSAEETRDMYKDCGHCKCKNIQKSKVCSNCGNAIE